MPNYEITGPTKGQQKVIKSCSRQKVFFVTDGSKRMWVSAGDHSWIRDICRDFGMSYAPVQALSDYETAPCGSNQINIQQHKANCNGCRRLAGQVLIVSKKGKQQKQKAVAAPAPAPVPVPVPVATVDKSVLGGLSPVNRLDLWNGDEHIGADMTDVEEVQVPAILHPTNGEVKMVVKAPGLGEFTLDGMVTLMKERMETAMSVAADYEAAIGAVTNLLESEQKLAALQAQIDLDRQALSFFWQENQDGVQGAGVFITKS